MKKIVNFCGNCPFFYGELGELNENRYVCVLSANLNLNFSYLNTINDEIDETTTPDWCPLKKEEYTFSFINFSDKRLEEIHNVRKQINEYSELDDEQNDKSDKIDELTSKLLELQKNEEVDNIPNENIELEINKSIEEIKNQMTYIEDVSNKLQQMLNNLSN